MASRKGPRRTSNRAAAEEQQSVEDLGASTYDDADFIVRAIVGGDRSRRVTSGPKSRRSPKRRTPGGISRKYLKPPADPEVWLKIPGRSTRLTAAISTYARNVAGLGWALVPKKEATKDGGDGGEGEIGPKAKRQLEEAKAFFAEPNPEMEFDELLECVVKDREHGGDGYFEILRDLKGRIAEAWHAQSLVMRVRVPGEDAKENAIEGFVKIEGPTKVRYFKKYGDERVINDRTGEVDPSAAEEDQANEIIHLKIYAPGEEHYGLPRYMPAVLAVLGNNLSAERNVYFFDNDACPRMLIAVSGGKLASTTAKMIEDFLRNDHKGPENAHRSCVIEAEPKRTMMPGQDNRVKIDVVPLTVGTVDDASFQEYRTKNDEEIREAFGLAEAFFKTTDVNRASAEAGRRMTEENIFEPERRRLERRINKTILQGLFPDEDVLIEFKLARPGAFDPKSQAEIDQLDTKSGKITPNDLRQRDGLEPYDGDLAEFGNQPLVLTEMQTRGLSSRQDDGRTEVAAPDSGDDDADDLAEDGEDETSPDSDEGAQKQRKRTLKAASTLVSLLRQQGLDAQLKLIGVGASEASDDSQGEPASGLSVLDPAHS